jgi:hypothetical protein
MDGSLLVGGREGDGEVRVAFARALYREYLSDDDRYGPLFREAELNAKVDELNVLYVALTRARENLVVLPRTRFKAGEDAPKTVGELLLSVRAATGVSRAEGETARGGAGGKRFSEEAGSPVPSAAGAAGGEGVAGGAGGEKGVPGKKSYVTPRSVPPSRRSGAPFCEDTLPRTEGVRSAVRPGAVAPRRTGAPGRTGDDETARAVSTPAGALAWEGDEPDKGLPGGFRKRRIESLKGLLVHEALESMRKLPANEGVLDLLLGRALARVGARCTRGEMSSALEKAKRSLKNLVSDDRMAVYFSEAAAREIVFVSAGYGRGMGRIDRALFGEEIRAVDFKTNETGGPARMRELVSLYRGQVAAYCDALAEVFPGKTVTGALYFTDAPLEDRFVTVYGG